MRKYLFLSGSESDEFYNKQRKLYPDVRVRSIFISERYILKIVRRIFLTLNYRMLVSLYSSWKYEVDDCEIIILPVSIYSHAIARFLCSHTNAVIVHWYWNPVSKTIAPDRLRFGRCELFSFDKNDCATYQLKYLPTYYFKHLKLVKARRKFDFFFIGADKGRLSQIRSIEKQLIKMGFLTYFHVTKASTPYPSRKYVYKNHIPYEEILERISESDAIIDIVQEGQSGLSQRPMEALFFNKKLVTTDVRIKDQDFYHPNNIFVINDDPITDLKAFMVKPIFKINVDILNAYDFGSWLECLKEKVRPLVGQVG